MVMKVKRKTQILYPKDIGIILTRANIFPGARVIESGAGSGALTTALANFVRPNGKVYSYDRNEEFLENAKKNVEKYGLSEWVEFKLREVTDSYDEKEVDFVMIDIGSQWDLIDAAYKALKGGSRLATICPTFEQLTKTVFTLEEKGFIYVIDGDGVYYDVSKYKDYGELSGQKLDDLKIALGLPVTEKIVLAKDELKKLQVVDPQGNLEQALDTALITRLDIYNERDRLQDSSRRVKIAHQQTLPTVNALVGYEIGTPNNNPGLELNPKQRRMSAGLDIDLNLNTKPERNSLRSAQISEQRSQRELELAEEQLRNTIRSDWRGLEVARKQYDLAQKGLALAQKRLEIEEALMEEGQGTARDIVESQDRLIVARDLEVSTLIDHVISRLRLWSDMGVLYIEKDGTWVDVLNKEKPKGES